MNAALNTIGEIQSQHPEREPRFVHGLGGMGYEGARIRQEQQARIGAIVLDRRRIAEVVWREGDQSDLQGMKRKTTCGIRAVGRDQGVQPSCSPVERYRPFSRPAAGERHGRPAGVVEIAIARQKRIVCRARSVQPALYFSRPSSSSGSPRGSPSSSWKPASGPRPLP